MRSDEHIAQQKSPLQGDPLRYPFEAPLDTEDVSEALLLLNGTDRDGLGSMEAAIESQRAAFTGLSTGAAILAIECSMPHGRATRLKSRYVPP